MNVTTTDRLKNLLPQLFNTKQLEGDYYLRFKLTDNISGLIDLQYVQESLNIDGDRLTAVPNLPEYVVGMMSARNQVFLAIDLAHLVGLSPQTVNLRQYQTIIVQIDSVANNLESNEIDLFGLTVKRIQGISRILPSQFIPATENVPDVLRNFVSNAVLFKSNEQKLANNKNHLASVRSEYSLLIDIPKLIQTKTNP